MNPFGTAVLSILEDVHADLNFTVGCMEVEMLILDLVDELSIFVLIKGETMLDGRCKLLCSSRGVITIKISI